MSLKSDPGNTYLGSESDVEQKVILPLLTDPIPIGLSYAPDGIYSKVSIKKLLIDKGASRKTYFPDFVYVKSGIPVVVVEAKAPGEDLFEAMREARLYAGELNSAFSHKADPVRYVIACDGHRLLAGFSNEAAPSFEFSRADFSPANVEFSKFLENFGDQEIEKWVKTVTKSIRPKRYWKPRKLVGGISAQSEEIGLNSFGVTIKSDFRGIFDPSSIEERNRIAEYCYIPSKRRERYVDSIDRTLRAIIPPSEQQTIAIDDTSAPKQIIKKLRTGVALTNQVLLLVGAAGAGKTTFVDHLRVKALPSDVRKSTHWIHVNMNTAPLSSDEIYPWLRNEILKGAKSCMPTVDFDELDVIRNVFRQDVEKFRKGTGRLYEADKVLYNQKLAEALNDCITDKHYSAQAHCKYLSSISSSLVVVVLDNCDKRLLEEQLLMFDAAQWLKTEFSVMVFLPLREETYDNNLSVPPLDTALKDLAFRIEAPRFDLILRARIDLAISELKQNPNEKFYYDLPNSMRATYTAADKVSYLNSIMISVFSTSTSVRRLLIGLSGRNMRRAMEIFLEFCSSGHISEDEIVKMVSSKGAYSLPTSLISQVLLRSKKRYYDSDQSYVVNLFDAQIDDDRPNFFVRFFILKFLDDLSPDGVGPRRRGYVAGKDIFHEASKLGMREYMLLREINYLAQHYCIVSEDFRTTNLQLDDLITISPSGRTHLYLIGNPYYIAAVAEDLWFEEEPLADAIATRIRNTALHYGTRTAIQNSQAALSEISSRKKEAVAEALAVFGDEALTTLLDFPSMQKGVKQLAGEVIGKWADADELFKIGSEVEGIVKNKKPYGFFIQLAPDIVGLLHVSKCSKSDQSLVVGNRVKCIVLKIDSLEKKIDLASHDL